MKRRNFRTKEVSQVYRKTNGKCFYCGAELPPDTDYFDEGGKVVVSKRNWDIDHVIPFSKGGEYKIENLVPSCIHCNRTKSAK